MRYFPHPLHWSAVAASLLFGLAGAVDSVATNSPPVVRMGFGNVGQSTIVLDNAGNRYFTGFLSSGSVDFNLGVGQDTKVSASQTGFVTRINADGTYGWTQIATPVSQGCALLLSADGQTLYWAGQIFGTARIGTTGNTITPIGQDEGFVAALDPATGAAKTAFGINGSGMQRFGGSLSDLATSLALSGNTLYVGGRFMSTNFTVGTLAASVSSLGQYDNFVAAVDAVTGNPITTFGTNSSAVQTIGGASSAEFLRCLATDGTILYVSLDSSSTSMQIGSGTALTSTTSQVGYIAALDATTGAGISAFGLSGSGLQRFGTNIEAMLLNGSTLYGCGFIFGTTQIGSATQVNGAGIGFVAALDKSTGQARTGFGLAGSGMQRFGGTAPTALAYNMVMGPNALYVCGYTSVACQIGGTGPAVTPPNTNTDGVILALDPNTGAAVTSFGINASGMQLISGTGSESAVGIALNGTQLVAILTSNSNDAGIGGTGGINANTYGGLLIPLDAATGAYPYPTITGPFLTSLSLNAAANMQIQTTGNPTSFSATNLPPGLALNPNTGAITGTPTAAGSTTVTVTVANSAATVTGQIVIGVVGDAVANVYPPVIQGTVLGSGQALAADAAGNTYVAGSFSGSVDFNPLVGNDPRVSGGSNDAFISRYNADGTYAWTTTFGGSGDDGAQALLVSPDGQTIYVAGYYTSGDARVNGAGPVALTPSGSTDGFVLALNAATGTAKTTFGVAASGIQRWGGFSGDDRLTALALNGNTLYAAGYYFSSVPTIGTSNSGIGNSGSNTADAAIIALNATTGAAVTTFGLFSTGMQHFGGALDDRANSIAINGNIVYVAGTYNSTDAHIGSNTVNVGTFGNSDGFIIALDGTAGTAVTSFGLTSSGIQHFGSIGGAESARAMIYANNSLYIAGDVDNGVAVAGTGAATGTFGGLDAAVICLDSATGAGRTTFGSGTTAIQLIGGSTVDQAYSLALSGPTLYVAGAFSSSTLRTAGSVATISNTGLTNAFVAALDASVGTPVTSFGLSGTGIQKFGGSGTDRALGLAVTSNGVFLSGTLTSTNAGVGGPGSFSGAGFGGFLASISPSGQSAPVNITLSNQSVAEHLAVGAVVGTFSTTDAEGGIFTYNLVTGAGSTDNASFTIAGSTLQTAAVFDLATKSSYSIRVRSTDSTSLFFEKVFTITVTAGTAPTNITLSSQTIVEHQPAGTAVGTFTTTDAEGGAFTYTLVAGTGSTDNASFAISGSTLQSAANFDAATKNTYSIRVRSTDSASLFFEKAFTITVLAAGTAPTNITLSSQSILEHQASGTTVGTFTTTDAEGGAFTYTLVAGAGSADNASFSISGSGLRSAAVFDAATQNTYNIRVRSTDATVLFFEKTFTIVVTSIGGGPTDIALSNSTLPENVASVSVGTLSTSDPDVGNTFTYALVAGTGSTDNSSFSISGATLLNTVAFNFETKNSYSIRIRTTDNTNQTFEKVFTISVTNVNEAPALPLLSTSNVPENSPPQTVVGALSAVDPDAGDTMTFSLVTGSGSTDNALFTISGNSLQTAAVLDFEARSTYNIRVRATDQGGLFSESIFNIGATNQNEPPTDIYISFSGIAENSPGGTTVGTFGSFDPDTSNTFTYTLVNGAGSADNTSFFIASGVLKTNAVFDYETKKAYSIRVRSTDQGGAFLERTLTIFVTNVNEAPTDIQISKATVPEGAAPATRVGNFISIDQDAGDTFTYLFVPGAGSDDNAAFNISGNALVTVAPFNFAAKSSYSIRVRSIDSAGLFFEKAFTISVTNVNERPTLTNLSNATVAENAPAGTVVGTLATTDPDPADTFTYALISGPGSEDNAQFAIQGNALVTAAVFDFEQKPAFKVRVRASDAGGLYVDTAFTIQVLDLNEAPTDINLSSATLAENEPAIVGMLTSTDPDANQAFTYALVDGPGAGDNASFIIQGPLLIAAAPFNFETKPACSIRVRSTDLGGLSVEKVFIVTITDGPDAPSAVTLSSTIIAETTPVGTVVGTLATQDEDAGDTFTYALVDPTGTTQNNYFTLDGGLLKLAQPLDFETVSQLTIHVVSTDSAGLSVAADFTLNVVDVDESPPQITSSPSAVTVVGAPFSYTITATGGIPLTFTAGPLPPGLSLSGDTISGVPTVQGIATITLTAANLYGTAVLPLTLTIGGNDTAVPVISSMSVAPDPGIAGQTLVFAVAIQSAHLTAVSWDFGDGSTGSGASAQHVYSVAGVYTAIATVSDGVQSIKQSLAVAVSPAPHPQGIVGFAVTQAALKINFAKHADTLKLTCDVALPENFSPAGQTIEISIGDYHYSTILSAKGTGGDAARKVKLAGSLKNGRYSGGGAVLSLSLSKLNLFDSLKTWGFTNADVKAQRVPLRVTLLLGGRAGTETPNLSYSAKAGKSGSAVFKY